MSNTWIRVIVAVVAIPVILWLVVQGDWWFTVFVELVAILGLKEYYDMARAKGIQPQIGAGQIAGAVFPILLYVVIREGSGPLVSLGVSAFFLVFVLWVLGAELWRAKPDPIVNTAVTIFGVTYVALCFGSLIGMRNLFYAPWMPELAGEQADYQGRALVFLMFGAIWICDSAAYFVGKAFGKHKIAPRVSPNKSWEGGIAGLIGSAATFGGLAAFFLPALPVEHGFIIGVLIGIVGQIGDFAESLLKRDAGIKDSSAIIPGH